MGNEFNTALRVQKEWSWLLAIDLFLGGVGGGVFLLYQALFLPPWCGLLALFLVLCGGIVLLLELGHPLRAWRAIFRPQTSWISRGVLCMLLFVISAIVTLAPSFPWLWWIPIRGGALLEASATLASLCAVFITLYPALVLGSSPSIPFWDSPLLPLVFFAQALLGATGMLLLVSGFTEISGLLPRIRSMALILIFVNLSAVAVYLGSMLRAGAAEKESVRMLARGGLGWAFRGGAVVAGLILPLIFIAAAMELSTAGACILAGGLLFRLSILKAGVYVPPPLAGLDLSGFKGDRAGLALEYADWSISGGRGVMHK